MATTYEPIATTTASGGETTFTFNSLGAYTDLYFVSVVKTAGNGDLLFRFNSDTASNYSRTLLGGDGTSAYSNRQTSATSISANYFAGTRSADFQQVNMSVMNYSNATTYKTALIRTNSTPNATEAVVGLWRNTAAITSLTVFLAATSFSAGSTFTLYGIKAA